MTETRTAHHGSGLYRLLDRAGVYEVSQVLLLRKGSRARYVREHVRPSPGCRILDIGCGPGTILAHLPESIGSYTGFDMNPGYVEAARNRWGNRGIFHCQRVEAATLPAGEVHDIVLANGVVHHLDDGEARQLFDVAWRALRPGGCLITHDPVRLEHQHWFARWLIERDRGKAVRSREGYEALARSRFGRVESVTLHDTLRVPYTVLVMRCTKGGEP
jgi:SAM-dependent methyltransferase